MSNAGMLGMGQFLQVVGRVIAFIIVDVMNIIRCGELLASTFFKYQTMYTTTLSPDFAITAAIPSCTIGAANSCERIAMPLPSEVVHGAPTSRPRRPSASLNGARFHKPRFYHLTLGNITTEATYA